MASKRLIFALILAMAVTMTSASPVAAPEVLANPKQADEGSEGMHLKWIADCFSHKYLMLANVRYQHCNQHCVDLIPHYFEIRDLQFMVHVLFIFPILQFIDIASYLQLIAVTSKNLLKCPNRSPSTPVWWVLTSSTSWHGQLQSNKEPPRGGRVPVYPSIGWTAVRHCLSHSLRVCISPWAKMACCENKFPLSETPN